MKKRPYVKILTIITLSTALNIGCAGQQSKESGGSQASSEAVAAIADANAAIKVAKGNNWIWRDTEKFAQQAQEAADKGDNAMAIKLADKAKFQAEQAVVQYNHEKEHPRGL